MFNFFNLYCFKINTVTILCIFLLLRVRVQEGSFLRNAEPVNVNWIFSMPYDVSNTLRAPLGGPASIILTAGLALIMFFGMAVSPVYYLLGTPSRKYHQHDGVINRLEGLERQIHSRSERNRNFPVNSTIPTDTDNEYPHFTQSLFWLIGEDDVNCQKLMVCHAHGFFNFLPSSFLNFYRFFSRKMVQVPVDFQHAIVIGLEDQSLCMPTFSNCSTDLVSIVKKTFAHVVPTDLSPMSKYVQHFQDWLEE